MVPQKVTLSELTLDLLLEAEQKPELVAILVVLQKVAGILVKTLLVESLLVVR
jgi:hypothetical protein